MRPSRWEPRAYDRALADALTTDLGVNPVVGRLLAQRGVSDSETGQRFLNPSLKQLHDPFQLTDLSGAVDRLLAAVRLGERIAVHGDYDVDGVASTVIVRRMLELLEADVLHYIPNRLVDGYGLEPAGIVRLHAEGVKVIVSVDCGIRSIEAADRARQLGMDLIVTDHHEPDAILPAAFAVINPKRKDCSYPDKNLAGVGVALKLVQALCLRTSHEAWLPAFVKIAAIGTIGDVVPLHGVNRVIARVGLDGMTRGPNVVGLNALLEVAGLDAKVLESSHVAFGLAPRINAAGRMSSPDLAVRLLLMVGNSRREQARLLARQLDEENARRKREEEDLVAQARKKVESNPDIGAHGIVVVAGAGWHRGVIGIVASRLVELLGKPTVVMAIDGTAAPGSGRRDPGFDLLSALDGCADLFSRFGGHRQAAGVTLEAGRVAELRSRLATYAKEHLDADDLTPRLQIDAPMELREITDDVFDNLTRLEPFGFGNPRPIFKASGVAVVDGPRVLKQQHLAMSVKQGSRVVRAVAWRAVERKEFLQRRSGLIDVAYSLMKNRFRGEAYLELSVADVREAR